MISNFDKLLFEIGGQMDTIQSLPNHLAFLYADTIACEQLKIHKDFLFNFEMKRRNDRDQNVIDTVDITHCVEFSTNNKCLIDYLTFKRNVLVLLDTPLKCGLS